MATVYITVYSVPVANDDSYSVPSGTTLQVNAPGVLGNDTYADGNPLTPVLVAGPADGSLTLNPDGSFSYTPNPGFFGTDSFTYYDANGSATSNVATVTITVYSVPVANNDSYVTVQHQTLDVGIKTYNVAEVGDTINDGIAIYLAVSVVPNIMNVGYIDAMPLYDYDVDHLYYQGTNVIAAYNTTIDPSAYSEAAYLGVSIYSSDDLNTLVQELTQLGAASDNSVLANDTNADGNPLTAVLYPTPPMACWSSSPTGPSDTCRMEASTGRTVHLL